MYWIINGRCRSAKIRRRTASNESANVYTLVWIFLSVGCKFNLKNRSHRSSSTLPRPWYTYYVRMLLCLLQKTLGSHSASSYVVPTQQGRVLFICFLTKWHYPNLSSFYKVWCWPIWNDWTRILFAPSRWPGNIVISMMIISSTFTAINVCCSMFSSCIIASLGNITLQNIAGAKMIDQDSVVAFGLFGYALRKLHSGWVWPCKYWLIRCGLKK